jgi:hypothetical protein
LKRTRRRISNNFGYIGFGNNQSVFNQQSIKPFSILKEQLNNETHYHHQVDFLHKKLTKSEKDFIKNKIRLDYKKQTRKTIFLFIIIFSLILIFIKMLIDTFMSNI